MNRTELESKIKSLQAELVIAKEQLDAMPKKWEPRGYWCVDVDGKVDQCSDGEFSDFGNSFQSQEQAEKAAKVMRPRNRLLASVLEFAPDWEPDWSNSENRCCVYFDHKREIYYYNYDVTLEELLGAFYMPVDIAEELCRKLNSGEVEL